MSAVVTVIEPNPARELEAGIRAILRVEEQGADRDGLARLARMRAQLERQLSDLLAAA